MSNPVHKMFMDSGAFSLKAKALEWAKEHNEKPGEFHDSKEFWKYMRSYVKFLKRYGKYIDHYVNLDVIRNPELSHRNLRYLEKKGLHPIPVVHYPLQSNPAAHSVLDWFKRYVDEGYGIVGIGGVAGNSRNPGLRKWLDECFTYICDGPDNLPRVKIHGFGVVNHDIIWKYPWFSIDSALWVKLSAFGRIYVPHKNKATGEYDYIRAPINFHVSPVNPSTQYEVRQVYNLVRENTKKLKAWLEHAGVPLGRMSRKGKIKERGVTSHYIDRIWANLFYLRELEKRIPPYPRPFTASVDKGLGLC